LHKEGIRKGYKISRLVASAFIPNPNNLRCVNHRDENKTNNHVSNLEWCSDAYNIHYGTALARMHATNTGTVRERIPVRWCDKHTGEVLGEFESITQASKASGVTRDMVRSYVRGKRKSRKFIFELID